MLHDPSFWTAIAFLIFLILLAVPVKNALFSALENRSQKIQSDLDQALKLREEAQELLAKYQRKQREGEAEAIAIMENAKKEADRLKHEAFKELELQLERRESAALERIAQAENLAIKKVHDQAVDVAILATQTLLAENIGSKRSSQLIENAIAEIPEKLT